MKFSIVIIGLCVMQSFPSMAFSQQSNSKKNCKCPNTYAPVCGSDGKDYDNRCLLNCASQGNRALNVRYFAPCNSNEDTKIFFSKLRKGKQCDCPNKNEPVCDSDKETHVNWCQFQCHKRMGTKIEYQGACDDINIFGAVKSAGDYDSD